MVVYTELQRGIRLPCWQRTGCTCLYTQGFYNVAWFQICTNWCQSPKISKHTHIYITKNWHINRSWGRLLFQAGFSSFFLGRGSAAPAGQETREEGRRCRRTGVREGGWQTVQDKGSQGQNNGKALWWNWSETACLQGPRPPSATQEGASLQSCLIRTRTQILTQHTNTHR